METFVNAVAVISILIGIGILVNAIGNKISK